MRLALLERVQRAYRIVRGGHLEFDVVHPDMEFRVAQHGVDGGAVSLLRAEDIVRALERVLRGDDKVDPVELPDIGEILHYGLVSDVQGVERP